MKLEVEVIGHDEIADETLLQVVALKDTFWPFGAESQLRWMGANLEQKDRHVLMRSESQGLAAYCSVWKRQHCLILDGVIVAENCRSQGVGRALMEHVMSCLIGSQPAFLLCEPMNAAFYAKWGWVLSDDVVVENKDVKSELRKMTVNGPLAKVVF